MSPTAHDGDIHWLTEIQSQLKPAADCVDGICAGGGTIHLHRKILRLRVVDDDGGGGLLRVELVFLGEGDADLGGA
jgi:hypothetical protein